MRRVLLAVCFLLTATVSFADQAPAGPIVGRAVSVIVESECTGPGQCSYFAFAGQKLYFSGVLGFRESVCTGQSVADINGGPCGPSAWLGNCQKTVAQFSTSNSYPLITGTITSCTNDHTGNCQEVTGHFDAAGRVFADSVSQTGGCQY